MQGSSDDHPWDSSPAAPLVLPDLAAKTALVTGASTGIGAAAVALLRSQGYTCFGVALGGWQHDAAPDFTPLSCDLGSNADIDRIVAEVGSHAGRLDYLVNVAGVDPRLLIEAGDTDAWDRVAHVNLRAYYLLIRAALPLLRAGSGKAIVNVSSINYRLGLPGRAIYSATKAGILGLTTGLARELGREGIRINTVSPGWVFTERQVAEYFATAEAEKHLARLENVQSLKLQIQAEDVANHILFYLSSVSRASTGHNCVVDAGWLLE